MTLPSVLSLKQTIISCLATALIVGGLSGWAGWKLRDSDYQSHLVQDGKDREAWNKKVTDLEHTNQGISQELNAELVAKTERQREITHTLIQKVPYYVTAKSDAACPVPVGLVELHNQATGSAPLVSTSSGLDREAPSTVTLSALTEVNIHNIGVAKELEAEVLTWRAWYPRQKAAWDALSGRPSDTKSGGSQGQQTSSVDSAP
jgi:hypothetical protein